MENRLVVIGHISDKMCFINVSRKESIKRWIKYQNETYNTDYKTEKDLKDNDVDVNEYLFDDYFYAYDAFFTSNEIE